MFSIHSTYIVVLTDSQYALVSLHVLTLVTRLTSDGCICVSACQSAYCGQFSVCLHVALAVHSFCGCQ